MKKIVHRSNDEKKPAKKLYWYLMYAICVNKIKNGKDEKEAIK